MTQGFDFGKAKKTPEAYSFKTPFLVETDSLRLGGRSLLHPLADGTGHFLRGFQQCGPFNMQFRNRINSWLF